MKTGFIGTGTMGSRMAANLLKKDQQLYVYNRHKEKAQALVEKGAELMETPADVAEQAEVIFTMLSTPEVVEKTAFGNNGFAPRMREDSIWVDCSTVNPSFSVKMAVKCKGYKVGFIDAPAAGSTEPAQKGALTFFVGGKDEDFNRVNPLLEMMGKKIVKMGGTGCGSAMKMVNNLMLGQGMVAFSEAMGLGESLNIDRQLLLNTLLDSPVCPEFLKQKKSNFTEGDYMPEFTLKLMHKDLYLMARTAYERKVALPAANAAKEVFATANQHGLGDEDFSVLCWFYEEMVERRREEIMEELPVLE